MKHFVGLMLLLLVTIAMTGCYWNPGASYGKLLQIDFLDENGEQLHVPFYRNQSCTYDDEDESTTLNEELTPLNSPAPGNYYFCITIPRDVDLTVRFIIVPGKTYQFYSIDLGETTISFEHVVVAKNDSYLSVDYVLSKDEIQEGFLPVSNIKMASNLEDETSIKDGTTKPHVNNSVKGIVIRFIQEEQTFTGLKQST